MTKYFVASAGEVQGECLVDSPANPSNLDIVDILDADLDLNVKQVPSVFWRYKNGKMEVDQQAEAAFQKLQQKSAKKGRAKAAPDLEELLAIDFDDLNTYVDANTGTPAQIKAFLVFLTKALWVSASK